jgi:citrate lyase subunit beta / citryl-CoA lyase
MLRPDLPGWRSLLFVPVTVERFVAAAHKRGADGIVLDLEDSVPEADKARARGLIHSAAERVGRWGADVVVRINRPWRHAWRDIEAAVGPGITALMCPKTPRAEHLQTIGEMLDDLEADKKLPRGHTRLIAMIETAAALFRAHEIAAGTPRLVGIMLGAEDFASSVGMEPFPDVLQAPNQTVIIAARAAGILPLGFMGTVADYKDLDAFRATIRRSRRFGFLGAACIHPGQVPILNEEYGPQPEEVSRAERLIAAYDAAIARGAGALEFEGKMIDVPVVERARRVLAHAARFRNKR